MVKAVSKGPVNRWIEIGQQEPGSITNMKAGKKVRWVAKKAGVLRRTEVLIMRKAGVTGS